MNRLPRAPLLGLLLLLAACGPGDGGLELGEERISPDEADNTAAMIEAIKAVALAEHPTGVIERLNQSKSLACFDARFAVVDGLDANLQQGVFTPGAIYPARLRFASARQEDDRDKDFHGVSIKLEDVVGPTLWGEQGYQVFLLNSSPALFAANPGDFRDFIEATRDGKVWRYFINPSHFYSLPIVLSGRAEIDNPFAIRYWSTTPYRFGDDVTRAVKYSLRPCAPPPDFTVEKHQDFLTDAMREHLRITPACFDFMVQFQTDPDSMPIENSAVAWDESVSPFIKLAEIRIEEGATSADTRDSCESMSFNPWQSLEAHRPLGGINRVRKPIYGEIGEFRQRENQLRQAR